jgi:polar amino acid transport system substrate-binding protein
MFSLSNNIALRGSLFAIACGAAFSPRADASATIGFCVDESSPAATLDEAVAKAVANEAGASAQIVYFDGDKGGDKTGFQPRKFRALAESQCDLIMGFPVEGTNSPAPPGLQHTRGYVDTGFVLLSRETAGGLDQLPQGAHVAVIYNTPPNLLFVDRPRLQPVMYESDAAGMHALEKRAVDAAIIWQPSVASYQKSNADAERPSSRSLDAPYTRWTLSALYAPRGEPAAKTFDEATARLEANGTLSRITRDYTLPPPVTVATAQEEGQDASPEADAGGSSAGVYTTEQAARGSKLFAEYCGACHGEQLQGRVGPALKGPGFASVDDEFTIGAMFTFFSVQMPAGAPSSLTHEQYADLMAFLLQENGYPAGSQALTYEGAMASEDPLISKAAAPSTADAAQ